MSDTNISRGTEPHPEEFWWPNDEGPWRVTIFWSIVDGGLEVTGLSICHRDNSEPITTALVREMNISGLIQERRTQGADVMRKLLDLVQGAGPDYENLAKKAKRELSAYEGGRHRYSPDHFVSVAQVYDRALAIGSFPTRSVADHFGVPRSTAAKWVMRCRDLRLLPPTSQRRARGNAEET